MIGGGVSFMEVVCAAFIGKGANMTEISWCVKISRENESEKTRWKLARASRAKI